MKPNRKELRSFGLILGGILSSFALLHIYNGNSFGFVILLLGAEFLLLGAASPDALEIVFHWWMKITHFIGNIFAKIALFVLYFFVFTPIALFMRLLKKDLLYKKIDKEKESYWIKRESQPQPMTNQF